MMENTIIMLQLIFHFLWDAIKQNLTIQISNRNKEGWVKEKKIEVKLYIFFKNPSVINLQKIAIFYLKRPILSFLFVRNLYAKNPFAYKLRTNLIVTIRFTVTVTVAQKVENGEILLGGVSDCEELVGD